VVKKDGMTEKSKGEMLEAERLKVEKKNLVAAFGDNHRILACWGWYLSFSIRPAFFWQQLG
jgi:hypothetical protein